MNFRTTLILLVAVLLVGAAAFWLTRRGEAPHAAPAEPRALVNVSEADITGIELLDGDGKTVVSLNRHGEAWRLSKPVVAPADQAAVHGLISSLTSLRSQGQVQLSGNENATGLDRPAAVAVLTARDGKSVRVAVGARTGTGGNAYVRIDSRESADLVPALLIEDLEKPAPQFRDRQLVPMPSNEIRRVVLAGADAPPVELVKSDDSDWRLVQPFQSSAEGSAATDLVFALAGLRAVDFAAEDRGDLARFELDRPQLTVTLGNAPASTQPGATQPAELRVAFGGFDDVLKQNVYAMVGDEGSIVKVPARTLESLQKAPLDLRDRRVLEIDPDRVRRLTIAFEPAPTTRPGEAQRPPVVIERAGVSATSPATAPTARWRLADGAAADENLVDSFLDLFRPLRVNRYLPTLNFVTAPSAVVVTIETDDGVSHVIRLLEGGDGATSISGAYNDLIFDAPAYVLERAKSAFAAP